MTEDRVQLTARLFYEIARENSWWVSLDLRIGLRDAAKILGLTHGHLRNLIAEGKGPRVYHLGGAGHRVTVTLLDLAEWRESRCA